MPKCFTVCDDCGNAEVGMFKVCKECGSENVYVDKELPINDDILFDEDEYDYEPSGRLH